MNPHHLDRLLLGRNEDPVELETSDDNRRAVLAMIRQTQRTLTILSRDLDAKIYDDARLVDAIKDLALRSRRSRVRIMVRDTAAIVNRGHRLIELYRRLPTYVDIRVPAKEHEAYNSAFLVSDRFGVIFRHHAGRYEGTANFNDQKSAEDLLKMFDEMWEAGSNHPDLRGLRL